MTTKFYHDCRSQGGNAAPINISISSKGRTAYIPTGIKVLPEQWDNIGQKVIQHPLRSKLNVLLQQRKLTIDNALFALQADGELHGLSASEIKSTVLDYLNPKVTKDDTLFIPRLMAYAERQKVKTTRYTYTHCADKIHQFDPHADSLRFEDITPRWLERFNNWMAEIAPSQNARNILLRDIRTVFNEALDDGIITNYPFRRFKIRPEATKSRALTIPQLRKIFTATGDYADVFKLCFFLGGISMCDLCSLTKDSITAGRIEFRRQKTKQLVSIGIQPEAQELLDRLAGNEHLIFVSDRGDYRTFLHCMNDALKHIGCQYNPKTKKWDGTPVCAGLSQYWARYSVATIAAEQGVSQDVIAAILGHSTSGVTSIYMRANRNKQVDEALRKVFDAIKE